MKTSISESRRFEELFSVGNLNKLHLISPLFSNLLTITIKQNFIDANHLSLKSGSSNDIKDKHMEDKLISNTGNIYMQNIFLFLKIYLSPESILVREQRRIVRNISYLNQDY